LTFLIKHWSGTWKVFLFASGMLKGVFLIEGSHKYYYFAFGNNSFIQKFGNIS